MDVRSSGMLQHNVSRIARPVGVVLCVVLLGTAGALAQPLGPAPAAPPNGIVNGQRQQPTRQGTQTLLRQDDMAPTNQERKQQLRTLNQLNQKLLPGSKAPAPNVEPTR